MPKTPAILDAWFRPLSECADEATTPMDDDAGTICPEGRPPGERVLAAPAPERACP
jgi:hypothetical protein